MENILEIKDLGIRFKTDDGIVNAVNGVTLELKKGEVLGLVGETGAGKTTTALAIMRLIQIPPGEICQGSILFEGREILDMSDKEMQQIRGDKISMIFQDPMTSLNPVRTVGEQITEVIRLHQKVSAADAMRKACEMLEMVGIPAERSGEYPHQFSGGMKQRVIIAIALACRPDLLIADEPTTALDVTIQAQVMDLMENLKKEFGTSMIWGWWRRFVIRWRSSTRERSWSTGPWTKSIIIRRTRIRRDCSILFPIWIKTSGA